MINILSAHGTFVNGKKIQAAWLRSGDLVRFGSVELKFVDGKGSEARISASASAPGKYRLAWMGLAFLIVVMILVLAWLAFR